MFDPQLAADCWVAEGIIIEGWVMVTVDMPGQDDASFTVTVYVVAPKFDSVVCVAAPLLQLYVTTPTLPVTFTEALPLLPPLHETLFTPVIVAVGPVKETVTVFVIVIVLNAGLTEQGITLSVTV